MKVNEIVDLTNLLFVEFCKCEFGINKGLLNTIEHWFYDKGIINIVERRKLILSFLLFAKKKSKTKQLKFGSGGLSDMLNSFCEKKLHWNED